MLESSSINESFQLELIQQHFNKYRIL